MLQTLKNAFKTKDVRDRLLFTFLMLVVIRFGCQLPVPGVDRSFFSDWFSQHTEGSFGFFDAFTGGSFLNMSVLALNITPYITSSIIIQLLTIAIPALEEMQKDGEDGRKKITTITRYVTVGLALIEASAVAIGFGNQGLLAGDVKALDYAVVIIALTAGSAFLMWVGERITEKGIGNGISIVLIINIISRIPSDMAGLYEQFVVGAETIALGVVAAVVIIAIILLTVVLTIILNDGVRNIPVQYAKKIQGRRTVGGQNSVIPLKINTAGVIPIIFASSLLETPVIISQLVGYNGTGIGAEILRCLSSGNWCNPAAPKYSVGLLLYIILVVFFAYFYTSITFNPLEVSNNIKKQGGYIPGIRPGKPTTEYLERILRYIIFIGAVGLIIVAVIPYFFNGVFGANVSFGGTSLIIIVSVVLETEKQIESLLLVRNYKGFLNK
ncbi:MAG TPA: preprotein translocase subunit SecY [Lachnospiraceae bacterium]|nr:preprotein translocase subunit SecY [Lachnospiraceae bacterium]